MAQWFFSYGNGEKIGPLDDAQAVARAGSNPDGYVWREGFAEWVPIRKVEELMESDPDFKKEVDAAREELQSGGSLFHN